MAQGTELGADAIAQGERVRAVRELAHLGIDDTSRLTHITPTRLEAAEGGNVELLAGELEDLAYAFGVSLDFLMDTDGAGGLTVMYLAMRRRRELDALRPMVRADGTVRPRSVPAHVAEEERSIWGR